MPYKNLSNLRIFELSRYLRNEKIARNILERAGIIKLKKNCSICRKTMKLHEGKTRDFFYCSRECNISIYIKHNTIMQNMKISNRKFILLSYLYFYKKTLTKALMRNLKISTSLINTLKTRIEDKIIKFSKNDLTLNGDYVTVKIDESLIAYAKYFKERFPKQTWVFGVVERESGKCYIQVVPDRSRKTLEAIIKKIVHTATIIISDKAKAYDNCSIILGLSIIM
ncbi:hypothetical protein DMUE_5932 [Dictyocoela muelleri]|nr:hypothetical protein DMUE_5932 [Dictyocoela muelleri]